MSYGRFAPRDNSFANMAYNDPWFAAGQLLAQNWNKNYEDRGMQKLLSEYADPLTKPTQNEFKSAEQMVNAQNQNQAIKDLQSTGAFGTYGQDQLGTNTLMGILDDIAKQPVTYPSPDIVKSVLDNYNTGEFKQGMLDTIANSDKKNSALQTLGFAPKQKQTTEQELDGILGKYATEAQAPTMGIFDNAMKAYNERMQNFNANDYLANMKVELAKKGISRDSMDELLEMVGGVAGNISDSNQRKIEAQRQAQINNLVQQISYHRITGDIGTANALQMELYPLLNADASAYTNYMKGAMPNMDLKSTDLGGETVFTSFDKTGQLPTNNALMPNSTSPNTVYSGQVSMYNNTNNNATSERNNIRSNSTSRQNVIDKINYDANLYEKGYKGNDSKTKVPKYATALDEGFAKALQAIDNNDRDSGKYVDDFHVMIGKYNASMDDDDKAHAQELLYGLNALREYKSGNKEMATTYANALSPEIKKTLGINF